MSASLSKDLITSEHWANHHELRAQPRRIAQSHNGFPFNNRLSGVTPPEAGKGKEGGEYCSSLSCELLVSVWVRMLRNEEAVWETILFFFKGLDGLFKKEGLFWGRRMCV